MNYSTLYSQLFKSSLNGRVISVPKVAQDQFNLDDVQILTMREMINCYWTPITHSLYLGQQP